MRRLISVLLLLSASAFGNQLLQGFCELGGQKVSTQGLKSSTQVQASYPQCLVTVYVHGTVTLAAIFSDNNTPPTPLANPFTSTSTGAWQFYPNNGHYDVVLSGGGFASPSTRNDILAYDPASAGIVYASNLTSDCTGSIDSTAALQSAMASVSSNQASPPTAAQ